MDADAADALRWDGVRPWYEAWYLTVSGRFWLRYSLHAAPEPTWSWWLASFAGVPLARKGPAPPRAGVTRGEVEGARWELELTPLAPPFELVHPLLRPVAKTKVVLPRPAVRIDGFVEVDGQRHEVADARGTNGHVFGTRHAERWGWAHATLDDGRWVGLLVAKVPQLPQVASYATDRHRRPTLRMRATNDPTALGVGPYRVEAKPEDFVGVTYSDPNGSPAYCYHAQSARLTGPGVDAPAALEYGTRTPLPDRALQI